MRLVAFLLVVIAGTHYGYAPLSELFPDRDMAARTLFYVLRGVEGVVLFAVIAWISKNLAMTAVCLWGCLEEGETAVCRLSHGITKGVRVELFDGLCGPHWYLLGLCVAAGLAALVAGEARK